MKEEEKQQSGIKLFFTILKRRLNLRTIFILLLLLSANSYAWFIYTSKVTTGVTAQVRSWNITFESDDTELSEYINFDVNEIYPGMTEYTNSITINNNGDEAASFSYEIEEANILGTTYTKSSSTTSNDIQNRLANSYPFTINLSTNGNTIAAGGSLVFTLDVVWPYDQGDDTTDTFWGNQAYNYKTNNPSSPSISLRVVIKAEQIQT